MTQLAFDLVANTPAPSSGLPESSQTLLSRYLGRHFGAAAGIESARLLETYGDLGALSRAAADLTPSMLGVSEDVAADLALLQPIAAQVSRDDLPGLDALASFSVVINYLRAAMQHEAVEQVRVLFLNRKNRLIADEVMARGTIDHAPVYPREIARRALILNASALIIAHNHPSGDASPSQADITMTKTLADILRPLEILIHDHIVMARNGHSSMKSLGLF